MYSVNDVLPQTALVTSLMQQKFERLRVSHIIEANDILKDFFSLRPENYYAKPTISTFCDA